MGKAKMSEKQEKFKTEKSRKRTKTKNNMKQGRGLKVKPFLEFRALGLY